MKGKMLIFRTGVPLEVREVSGSAPDDWSGLESMLADLQKILDDYLELVPYFDSIVFNGERVPCVVFCGEEGKRLGRPVNWPATDLWRQNIAPALRSVALSDQLVGNVVVLVGDAEFMASL